MRRRSPAAVQKWVDSIPANSNSSDQTESPSSQQCNSNDVECENANNDNNPESSKSQTVTDDSENNNPKENNCSSAAVRSAPPPPPPTPQNKPLSIFNKGKISELYQKLDLNKKRYNILKAKSIEKLDKLKNMNLDHHIKNKKLSTGDSTGMNRSEMTDSTKPPIDTQQLEIFEFDENLDMAAVTTSTPDEMTPNNSSASKYSDTQLRQKLRMANIGRSFSENRASEMDESNNFQINERNNSCPNEIPNMTMMMGLNKKMDNFNICTSIQNCDSTCDRFNSDNVLAARSFSFSDRQRTLFRDNSVQSDSSHCSSVESLLESRKPDPESILINLGFGPVETEDVLSKIPKR